MVARIDEGHTICTDGWVSGETVTVTGVGWVCKEDKTDLTAGTCSPKESHDLACFGEVPPIPHGKKGVDTRVSV